MLAFPGAFQGLEPVRRRYSQIVETLGRIEIAQLTQRDVGNISRNALDQASFPDRSCLRVPEIFDHLHYVSYHSTKCNGYVPFVDTLAVPLDPALQFAPNHRLDNIHAFVAVVEAGNVGKVDTAIVPEDFGASDRDLLKRFQTI